MVPDTALFKLLGISSHENDYRISWALNSKLGLKFSKTDNFNVQTGRNTESRSFSVFQSVDEDRLLKMNLISNRCPDGFLARELKNIDFFLQIFGEISKSETDMIITKLKAIEFVSTVFEIEPGRLKPGTNLPAE